MWAQTAHSLSLESERERNQWIDISDTGIDPFKSLSDARGRGYSQRMLTQTQPCTEWLTFVQFEGIKVSSVHQSVSSDINLLISNIWAVFRDFSTRQDCVWSVAGANIYIHIYSTLYMYTHKSINTYSLYVRIYLYYIHTHIYTHINKHIHTYI